MKNLDIKRDKKGRFSAGNGRLTGLVLIIFAMLGVVMIVLRAIDWGALHQVQRPWEYEYTEGFVNKIVKRPLVIDREPVEIISPLAMEVLEPQEELTPVEQKIVDKWGVKHGYIALAVFRCESGLRTDAVNWSTQDVGIGQINWPIWEDPIRDQFGYTLVDMFDEDKNLEVAYWIYDRADGEIDGSGNFTPWVVFNTGAFTGCIK